MKEFYVYKLTDMNHVPFYIGKGMKYKKYNRVDYHRNYWKHSINPKLKRKIKKLGGIFNTEFVMVSYDERKCLDEEMRLIKEIGLKNLCNLTDGGEGISGYNHTPTTKKTMSEKAKTPARIKVSIENLKRATNFNIGKKKLSQHHDKIIQLYDTLPIRDIANILNSDFAQVKRYLMKYGLYVKNKNHKPASPELRKLRSINSKKMMRAKSKPISQFTKNGEFIRSFASAPEACEFLGKPTGKSSYLLRACTPKAKSAWGYKWEYKII
jgi:hypothetical protein